MKRCRDSRLAIFGLANELVFTRRTLAAFLGLLALLLGLLLLGYTPAYATGLLAAISPEGADSPTHKTVLLLFPYQADLPQTVLAQQAIQAELGSISDLKLDWYYEYLDLNRFPSEEHRQHLVHLYATRYYDKPIDLVFLASEATLDFWLQYRDEILPGAPVVVYDILPERLAAYRLPSDVTGLVSIIDQSQLLTWIPRACPKITEIVVVQGIGKAAQEYNTPLDTLRDNLDGQIHVTGWSHLPLPEIKRRAAALPSDSIIFYQLMFEDAAGNTYRPIDVLRELTSVSAVPVISKYDQFIGTGTIGGYMYSIEQITSEAAQIGARILHGEAARDIPIVSNQSNHFIFDHLALQHWDIPLSALPAESIIKNRQYTIWEQYRPQLIGLGVGVTGLLFMAAYLGVLTRRLSSARQALHQLNLDLENQVRERTAALSQSNRRLEEEITERRQVEKALRESEQKYRLLVETATDVIWTMNETQEFTYISPAILQLRGLTPEEAMQESLHEAICPEFLALIAESFALREAHHAAGKTDFVDRMEIQQPRKDGSRVWVDVITRELYDAQGNRVGILGISRNITQRKQMETELIQAKEAAEEAYRVAESANQAKSTFLANMSHELRTPLNAVLGFSQLMSRGTNLTPKQRQDLETIERSGEHLLALINSVLGLSKIESGKERLESEVFDLHMMLLGLGEMFSLRAEQKGLTLAFDLAPDVPRYIRVDAGKLRQVLINLLGNAVKFTEHGGITVRVRLQDVSHTM